MPTYVQPWTPSINGTARTTSVTFLGKTYTGQTSAWGGGNTGGGGGEPTPGVSLTISLRRGLQQVAPEGIAFFANVSGFDAIQRTANPPAPGEVYDPAMHEITFVWDFGDPGSQSHVHERMLPEWNDLNVGYGPFPAHVFANPGTYTVNCAAYERSSGKQAFASVTVTVADPNVWFADSQTIVIDPDGDFAGAPTSVAANRCTSIAAANSRHAAIKNNGDVRILYRAGKTHPFAASLSYGNIPNVYINTWGGTARAIVTSIDASYEFRGTNAKPGGTIANIDFRGPWDAANPGDNTSKGGVFFGAHSGFCVAYNCKATGVDLGYMTSYTDNRTFIAASCSVEGWKNMGFYLESEIPARDNAALPMNSYVGLVGCRATQNVQATANGLGKQNIAPHWDNDHGPLRAQDFGFMHIDGFEGFTRNGWTRRDNGWPASQQVIRDHRNDPRSKGYISRLFAEGGFDGAYKNMDAQGRPSKPCNTVLDKFMMLGCAETAFLLWIGLSCTTARNGVMQRPNKRSDSNKHRSGITIGDLASKQTTENTLYPVRVHNITIVNELDQTEDPSSWLPVEIFGGFWSEGQVQVANNVVHRPNFPGGFVGDMPLDTTRLPIEPRYLGYKWRGDAYAGGTSLAPRIPMDTFYATPSNQTWSFWRPMTGSPAIGSATGNLVAYDDLLGNVRPASASRGATEPA